MSRIVYDRYDQQDPDAIAGMTGHEQLSRYRTDSLRWRFNPEYADEQALEDFRDMAARIAAGAPLEPNVYCTEVAAVCASLRQASPGAAQGAAVSHQSHAREESP